MSTFTEQLFFLDWPGVRILSVKTDGSDVRTVVTTNCKEPDGIAVDVEADHLYRTNMGMPEGTTAIYSGPMTVAGRVFAILTGLLGILITGLIVAVAVYTPREIMAPTRDSH